MAPQSNLHNHQINSDFVPRFQTFASVLSAINSFIMLSLGSAFLFVPQEILYILIGYSKSLTVSYVMDEEDNSKLIIGSVTRMVGGVLIAQAFSCDMLLYPMFVGESLSGRLSSPSQTSCSSCTAVANVRISIAVQAVTGLLWIIVGLLDDRAKEAKDGSIDQKPTLGLLLIGFVILVIASLSLMLSFWPVVNVNVEVQAEQIVRTHGNRFDDGLSPLEEPLLTTRSTPMPDNILQEQNGDYDASEIHNASQDDEEQLAQSNNELPELMEEEFEPDTSSDAHEPTSRIQGTRRLLSLAAPQVVYLYIGCITLLIRLPFSLCIPHLVSTTLGALSQGQFDRARREVFWLFVLGSIDACLDFWCIFWFGYANQRIVRAVRIDTFLSILKQDIGFFDGHTSGELASRLNADCGEMAGDLTWFFRFSIESVVRITGITAYMWWRSPKLGACVVSIVPVVAVVNKYYGNWLRDNASRVQDALAAANSVAQETLVCIRTVVAFASEDFEHNKYVERINEQYRLNVRQTYMTGIYFMFISTFLINTVVQGTLLLVGSYMIERGNLTSEILLAFMLYQGQLQNEMMNLFNSYSSLVKSTGAGDKVFDILDRKPPPPGIGSMQVRSREGTSPLTNDGPLSIRLENVTFSYPARSQELILNGINLDIEAGKTLALVGPSGCGKSTIVNLLQRFYDVSSGQIKIDGMDIKACDLKEHRRRIGIVTQDPILFSGTILSNITYGTPNATKEEAIQAAIRANAHDFICAMEDGYDTEVGERGTKLSGGQKQRIAISRAIIRQPSLLLLDEATSALDAESEEVVQKSIDSLLKESMGITTLIIAHRLRTVQNADLIVCINEGRIIELGNHDHLMALENGYYKGMVAKSMGGKLITD